MICSVKHIRRIPFIVLFLFVCKSVSAQEVQVTAEDNTFGGWNFITVEHDFPKAKMYVMGHFEVENYQFQRLDCLFGRFSVGCKPLKWLKFSLNYVPCYVPGLWLHFLEGEVTGTLKSGNFSVSIRERYRHGFTNSSDELRSRLKVAYRIGESKFTPYLAVELQTWSKWLKTRHYVACTYDILDFMQLEWYYMYYLIRDVPAEHVIGLGLNFSF